jgi:hypothetical protein
MHVLYLYIYLSIVVCYNLLLSYDHSNYKVGIFTGCIYVQSIFILIDLIFHLIMGNDIAAHRAAIGLFYCKTNGISLKTVFLSSFVSEMFSLIWRFFFVIFLNMYMPCH